MAVFDIFVDRIESNGILVATNNADEVPVGTVFTQLVKVRIQDAQGSSTAIKLWSKPVNLRLIDVAIYRRSVPAMPKGWGAGLRLEGAGLELVTDALIGKIAGEFIHLRTLDAS